MLLNVTKISDIVYNRRKEKMKFKSIGDIVVNVVNNIYAKPSEIKEAIDFLSVAKGTKDYTGMDIISMKSTLEWRLAVINHCSREKVCS